MNRNVLIHALKGKFDKCCILTMSHRKDRQEHIQQQCMEYGFPVFGTDSWLYNQYATSFPYNALIASAFVDSGKGRFTKPNEYDCARNHYNMVKMCYDMGYSHCLIMEDDICFHGDIHVWFEFFDNIPEDYDILQFGGFSADPTIQSVLGVENGYWVKHKQHPLWTTSMYALSRKGMKFYLAFMDKIFCVADMPLYKAVLNDRLVNVYMPTVPLVIQASKDEVSSDIRSKDNDSIDYENCNYYESKVDKKSYFGY